MTMNKVEDIVNRLKNGEITATDAAKLYKSSQSKDNIDDSKVIFCNLEWKKINATQKPDRERKSESTVYIGSSEEMYKILKERTNGKVLQATAENYKEVFAKIIEKKIPINDVVISSAFLDEDINTLVIKDLKLVLDTVQWISKLSVSMNKMIYYCYPLSDDKATIHSSCIAAFLQSVHLENQSICYKVIGLDDSEQKLKEHLLAELEQSTSDRNEVMIKESIHYYKQLNEYPPTPLDDNPNKMLKKQGVYVITGGAGKLGGKIAYYIATHYKKSKIILVGRSKICKDSELIGKLNATKSYAEYYSADISDRDSVVGLVSYVKSKYGHIDGVIHFAGLVKDMLYVNKKMIDIVHTLESKVFGINNFDEVLRNEPLDFMILNSSTTSIIGNVGQCDYAYANRYLDEFAANRNRKVAAGKRYGKTIAIDWPLWDKGGMKANESTKEWMKKKIGFEPISDGSGLKIFETSIKFPYSQVGVMYGDVNKIRENIFQKEKKITRADKSVSNVSLETIHDQTIKLLKKVLSDEIKLLEEKITEEKSFGEYGLDSITTVNMTRSLEEKFGELPKTLFYEYQNINDLSAYFISQHQNTLIKLFQLDKVDNDKQQMKSKKDIVQNSKFSNRFTQPKQKIQGAKIVTNVMDSNIPEEEIAIIGVSGRYPMATNLDEYWENLKSGRDCISKIPLERWDYKKYYQPEKGIKGKSNGKWGGFIDDVDKFDALFFHMTPLEAQHLDPQERLFLQTAWHTIEDSGYKVDKLCNGNVGVFVGVMYGEYQFYGIEETLKGNSIALGSSYASIANRVSYTFNFCGPSMAIDTMCSSSLTSIHLACESIRKGECEAAIAGGVNVSIHPNKYMLLGQTKFLDSTGRCHTFGNGGDGYIPGEGVGAVLLKPLSKAKKNKDHIYAIIKASEINHGGKTSGFTVPNPVQQGRVISNALKHSKINPRTLSYIEAHGTGTALGDPIEIAGLNKAFRKYTDDKQFCAIGSVKSNIGHLESAAGIAAITKVILQMKYKKLVPSIHSEELNSNIDFNNSPFFVQHDLENWERPVVVENNEKKIYKRRAGVSSFGAGGSNAHIILEEYEEDESEVMRDNEKELIIISAKDQNKLKEYASEIHQFIKNTYYDIYTDTRNSTNEKNINLDKIIDEVLQVIVNIIHIDKSSININDTLEECGIDRINLSELLDKLSHRYSIEYTAEFYEDTISLRKISEYLYQQIRLKDAPKNDNQTEIIKQPSLRQIAYTLQNGRISMEERLAIVTNSIDDLYKKLDLYVNSEKCDEGVFYGNAENNKMHDVNKLLKGESGKSFINAMIVNRELDKLAQLYISGIVIDWGTLYETDVPFKVSLPLYPFAKERCWYEKTKVLQKDLNEKEVRPLSAFLDKNISSFTEQKYETIFRLEENKISSLFLNKQMVLMPSILLEMAWEAAEDALFGEKVQRIKKVEFNSPVVFSSDEKVLFVNLKRENQNFIYEISSDYGENNKIIYSKGVLEVVKDLGVANMRIDIDKLQKVCRQYYSKQKCYEVLDKVGYEYTPTQQFIESLKIVENKKILCEISDLSMIDDMNQIVEINPYILETIFQSIFIAINMNQTSHEVNMVFQIKEICRFRPVANAKWIYIDGEESYVLDGYGNVLLKLEGVMTEQVEVRYSEKNTPVERIFTKGYKQVPEPEDIEEELNKTVVLLANDYSISIAEKLAIQFRKSQTVITVKNGEEFAKQKNNYYIMNFVDEEQGEQFINVVTNEFGEIATIVDLSDIHKNQVSSIRVQYGKIRLLQRFVKHISGNRGYIVHITNGLQQFKNNQSTLLGADIAGFVKMLGSEYGKILSKTVDIDIELDRIQDIADIVYYEVGHFGLATEICYREGKRYVTYMKELDSAKSKGFAGIRVSKDKVVVITGGTHGIGALLANKLVEKGFRKLVLMGRQLIPSKKEWSSALNSNEISNAIKTRIRLIQDLEEKGAEIRIYSGSLLDKEKVANYFTEIRNTFGEIYGVIHCAGVSNIENPAFINKSVADMKKVFEPKILGVQVLHDIFVEDQLQFFVLFSSISGVIPSLAVGNSDYAAANDFLNAYARYQNQNGYTYYKTISWPSWKSVGMGTIKSSVYKNLGFISIDNKQGLSLFRRSLKYEAVDNVIPLVVKEDFKTSDLLDNKVKLNTDRLNNDNTQIVKKKRTAESLSKQETAILIKLKNVFSSKLGIPIDQLKNNIEFNDFGVDSIIIAEIMKEIEDAFDIKIEPSILIEYSTLVSLSKFLENSISLESVFEDKSIVKEVTIDDKEEKDQALSLEFVNKTLVIKSKAENSTKNRRVSQNNSDKIAVIGMACDFPKAKNISEFWNNLNQGLDCITEVPKDRWSIERLFSTERKQGKTYSKWGGFIDGFEYFDADYFKVRSDEAQYLHPLCRLVLENSIQTLRDAGYRNEEVSGKKVGIFMGARMLENYASRNNKIVKTSVTGSAQNFIAAYLSQFLNVTGPSLVVDTACSSSLVSIYLACQSLITEESEMAIAGGVELLLDEKSFLLLSESQALSPDGKCHTFDEKANGFALGEGCGCVMLKRLDKAIQDKDHIYAVIEAATVNNDGNTMGLTTPNPKAQQAVILNAMEKANVSADSISMIEAHGTGTMIGDPIELRALTNAFKKHTSETQYCGIGSVKTNIGHLLSAAGVASFIKTVLCVYNKKMVPTLNCETPNPRLHFEESPFYPIKEVMNWKPRKGVCRAGISSLGFGGTNAHIIVSDEEVERINAENNIRTALLPQQFNKKRYWLEKKGQDNFVIEKKASNQEFFRLRPMLDIEETENMEQDKFRRMLEIVDESKEEY
ncbi:beta-ketoacyl synthase [Streptococcus mutans SA38]|uniref:SDR family NAD(P)-dependent oxidoreductase n=2 Tax=Streptococcus mutans TaxID=1309 RepID=UPI0002B56605|nr:SDR family NAD(P)-dependent oxidoreductase [Streptococcus mutans]EMB63323.1 beta-ketoacyl synthase [Streptococcus mutans 4SM1]EMC49199.1 beta-ketoacyl synthase [Streptococcus mutans SA38]